MGIVITIVKIGHQHAFGVGMKSFVRSLVGLILRRSVESLHEMP